MVEVSDLKVGDKIRIVSVPGEGDPNYYLHPETRAVYERLIVRKRPVRIYQIDKWGQPWYNCRFRMTDGSWERHTLSVNDGDKNWEKVESKNK